ncbi:UPF0545 protein C22orf39 homolog isoform X2 [Agrilus planipennis]|uniref:Synaptic plasticity regulator PANTS n=1 Tax=Agrilus planipennis TaxID=224129 RepID=A0A1W4WED3_AGRPL|nr:UPF0545 protein C22orf39 homolog isoform X2 [Agrilus planipennis]XP_018318819.1 UPF0545 protein C22orf39 homolog isoform X2 [Agrilus planipennis]
MPENEKNNETNLDREWMIRDCDIYSDEYSDCTSIKARFHQYFVFGTTLDCSQWKRDCDNCWKWKELIKSECNRHLERLRNHYANDVWEKRSSPPEDWEKPLPEHMIQEYEHSFLHLKAKEMRGDIPSESVSKYCSIM